MLKIKEFKKTVLETWKGVPPTDVNLDQEENLESKKTSVYDFKENVRRLRVKTMQTTVMNKWKGTRSLF